MFDKCPLKSLDQFFPFKLVFKKVLTDTQNIKVVHINGEPFNIQHMSTVHNV
jgi:hypothetical protein